MLTLNNVRDLSVIFSLWVVSSTLLYSFDVVDGRFKKYLFTKKTIQHRRKPNKVEYNHTEIKPLLTLLGYKVYFVLFQDKNVDIGYINHVNTILDGRVKIEIVNPSLYWFTYHVFSPKQFLTDSDLYLIEEILSDHSLNHREELNRTFKKHGLLCNVI